MLESSQVKPKMSRKLIWFIVIFDLLLVAGILTYFFFPFKGVIESKVITTLEAGGLKVSKFEIHSIDTSKASISELNLGSNSEIKIKDIVVNYDAKEVVSGKIKSLEVGNVLLNAVRSPEWISIEGLESLFKTKSEKSQIDIDQIFKSLPDKVTLKNISLNFSDKEFSMDTSVSVDLDVDHNNKTIHGIFKSSPVVMENSPIDIYSPVLEGSLDLKNTHFTTTANLASKDATFNINLIVDVDVQDMQNGKFEISKFKLPIGGGFVTVDKIITSTGFKKPIPIKANVKNVELSDILGKVTNGEIEGDGRLSGSVKLVYHPSGQIEIQNGQLEGGNEGLIKVSPALIPGDNDQVKMTRTILENFKYNILEMSIIVDKDDNSLINMKVEGTNPSYMEGRKVKLNINLSGDTIPMLKRSLLPMNDVKTIIDSEDKNEK